MSSSTLSSTTLRLPKVTRRFAVGYATLLFGTALIFGGGTRQGSLGDALTEMLALPLLAWSLATLRLSELSKEAKLALGVAGAMVMLLVVQMIPLPPVVWSNLPGRLVFLHMYESSRIAIPWLPISLDAAATWQSTLCLLPGLALFAAVTRFKSSEREALLRPMIPIAIAGCALSVLQVIGGEGSSLRFYEVTNLDRAVGFFANANHFAAFLYCVLPLAAALVLNSVIGGRQKRIFGVVLAGLVFCLSFVGLSLTQSRAGLALGLLSAAFSVIIAFRSVGSNLRTGVLKVGIAAAAIALLISFQFGFAALSDRAESQDLVQDLRWPVAQVTVMAAAEYIPIGSGVGTFQPIYEMSAPRRLAFPAFVNHAHDDWLELWLEAGVPGAIILAGFLGWYFLRSFQVWLRPGSDQARDVLVLARAGSIVILLLLMHSLVDYPLRTTAMMSLLAVCCGFLIVEDQSGGISGKSAFRSAVSPAP